MIGGYLIKLIMEHFEEGGWIVMGFDFGGRSIIIMQTNHMGGWGIHHQDILEFISLLVQFTTITAVSIVQTTQSS